MMQIKEEEEAKVRQAGNDEQAARRALNKHKQAERRQPKHVNHYRLSLL
jgi:hypothetical protein